MIIKMAAISLILLLLNCGCYKHQNDATTSKSTLANPSSTIAGVIDGKSTVGSNDNKSQSNSNQDLTYLRKWIGKYPINLGDKHFPNIFYDPTVNRILTTILGQKKFDDLLGYFEELIPIEDKDGFLVIFGKVGFRSRLEHSFDSALVAINPKTGKMHVFFINAGILRSFSNQDSNVVLPKNVRQIIKAYATANRTEIINPIKYLNHLKKWIGKYPINHRVKNFENIFSDAAFKKTLVQILGQSGFKSLLKHFAGTQPIEMKKGFLTIVGSVKIDGSSSFDHALVAVDPKTSETHVFFVTNGKLNYFSNTKDIGTLPVLAKKDILVHVNVSRSFFGIIRNPPKGFGCYALTHAEWERNFGNSLKRKYVFILTDESEALVNISGKDMLLKYSDSKKLVIPRKQKSYLWKFGKKKIWNLESKKPSIRLTLKVTSTAKEGATIFYEGSMDFSRGRNQQTIQIKAVCYD